jgi:UrcA family protein
MHSFLKPTLLASALGTLLFATGANAQSDGRYDQASYSSDASESIQVTAPRFHENYDPKGALQNASLSRAVPYDDLDLRTREGARELRSRVREAARDVCGQLADNYPGYTPASCFKDAMQIGLSRADYAIQDARE